MRPPFIHPHAPGVLDVNQPDYPSQTARALGVQNSLPGQIDPRVNVGIQLDDWTQPEFWWLRRGLQGLFPGVSPAVAAQFGWVGIQGAPNVLTVVERVVISNSGVASLPVQLGITTVTPSAGAYFPAGVRDVRNGLAGQCATTGAARSAAALSASPFPILVSVPAGSSVIVEVPWVITGALFLNAQSTVVNVPIAAAFSFRERAMLSQEA